MKKSHKYMHVCMTPALIDQFDVSDSIVVVIDILRATSTMCMAFDKGVSYMVPVAHIDECLSYKKKGFLLAGERGGVKIEGFDLGNSPLEYTPEVVQGQRIAMTTTNGTRALKAAQARNAKEIIIGSFANISALTQWLIKKNENICLLCAGWKDNVTLEDTIFAGAMARKLRHHFQRYQDTTLVAETLFNAANTRKRYFFRNSSHFQRLIHLNLQEDVKYVMRKDTHPVLPILMGDELHDISDFPFDYETYRTEALMRQNQERLLEKVG